MGRHPIKVYGAFLLEVVVSPDVEILEVMIRGALVVIGDVGLILKLDHDIFNTVRWRNLQGMKGLVIFVP